MTVVYIVHEPEYESDEIIAVCDTMEIAKDIIARCKKEECWCIRECVVFTSAPKLYTHEAIVGENDEVLLTRGRGVELSQYCSHDITSDAHTYVSRRKHSGPWFSALGETKEESIKAARDYRAEVMAQEGEK